MSVPAKIVHRAAGFKHLKRLVTLGTAELRGVMRTTGTADKFTVAERQRLLTFFTRHTHDSLPCPMNSEQKKEGQMALIFLTLILFHMRQQTLTFTLLRWRQQVTFAFIRVITLFELNADWRSHHVE